MARLTRRDVFQSIMGLSLTGMAAGAVQETHCYANETEVSSAETTIQATGRWSEKRAADWYSKYPWIVGCNYVPSTAVNQLEMWQADTFDPKTIDHELGMAEKLNFNTIRIFLHDLAWQQDKEGFKKRLSNVFDICEKHHIVTIPTFFTNGGPGTPIKIGKQPEPLPGVHNSQWLQSPGVSIVNNPEKWGYLEEYVTDILATFARDSRIFVWCLYNEPESVRHGNQSLPLLRRLWQWGRQVNPTQPFTAPITVFPQPGHAYSNFPICCFLGENCDMMSFHCYRAPEHVENLIGLLEPFHRPIICTEYIDRPINTFFNVTPILKKKKVGAIHFGLVNGKCNFQFHSKNELPEPKNWKHDIFRQDGTPFDPKEIEQIKNLTGKK